MPALDSSFPGLVAALAEQYGRPDPQAPSSGLEPFEALVATVLDRLTDPKKAAAARKAWRDDGLLDPQVLAEADPAELVESLRSAGVTIPEKSLAPLRKVARWLVDRHHGSLDDLASSDSDVSTAQLRDELREISGIGPATADAILLFALRRPSYPVDRATYRIFVRHGWIDPSADYDEAREAVEGLSPDDPATLAALSTWFERIGRDFCRVSVAKCDRCPLAPFLPEGGPLDPSG
jgi:endonuclease-3 related protein